MVDEVVDDGSGIFLFSPTVGSFSFVVVGVGIVVVVDFPFVESSFGFSFDVLSVLEVKVVVEDVTFGVVPFVLPFGVVPFDVDDESVEFKEGNVIGGGGVELVVITRGVEIVVEAAGID